MSVDEPWKMAYIARAVAHGRYRYTVHGAQQRVARGILRYEVEAALASGQIIEDYPEHRCSACCLVLGRTAAGKALHILCSLRDMIDIITVYVPDPHEWESDLKTRRHA
jgi:hypothetical protein